MDGRIEGRRGYAVGAEVTAGGVRFRVWAPGRKSVEVTGDWGTGRMQTETNGYYTAEIEGLRAGARYKYRLDGEDAIPDPASRFQPEGPHGPSQVIDSSAFSWTDSNWGGLSIEGQVLYEMHFGTFTREGTYASAARELPHLADLGVTVLEIMPLAEFTGRWGWGYDGVALYAPSHLYGEPDDLRRFVNEAHRLGMAVIHDVVYNHVGADGNYLSKFSKDYFSQKHTTDWGDAINFDGPNSGPVRDFFIENAGYWISEFHMDGLRLDATQNIYDETEPHVLLEITRRVREAAGGRKTIIVSENEPQHTKLVRPESEGGYGMDGLWNDDLHHSAMVALTGHNDAYYTDYLGTPQEFVSAAKYGYLYQGQRYKWQKKRRGTSTIGVPPSAFVTFIQNHDQIANSARGMRVHRETSPGLLKALTAFLLLGPGTPMLFQGQEFASSAPFRYFSDMPGELCGLVREGRKEFLGQWRSIRMPEMAERLVDPCDPNTFESCKLDHSEREKHSSIYRLHRDLLRVRREDPLLHRWRTGEYDGAVLGDRGFVLRIFGREHGDRLLVVNLGLDLALDPSPEPLLAPPENQQWNVVFSTEHPDYGGCGTPPLDSDENWRIPGQTAVLLTAAPRKETEA